MKSLTFLLLLSIGFGLAAAEPEEPEEPEESEESEESTPQDTSYQEEVEVVADAPRYDVIEVPKELADSGRATNLAVALLDFPGLAGVRRAQSAVEPVIRGMGWERVQTEVNGVPLYGACPARMDPPATIVTAAAVETSDLVMGLGSVTYGPAGTGGRISSSTDHDRGLGAGKELEPWVRLAYDGARSGMLGSAGVRGGTETLDYAVGLEASDLDDYQSGDGTTVPAGQKEAGGFVSFGQRVGEAHRWNIGAMYKEAEDIDFPSLPMDTDFSENGVYNLGYRYKPPSDLGGKLSAIEARIGFSLVDHQMSNRNKANRPVMEAETRSDASTGNLALAVTVASSVRSSVKTGLDYVDLGRDALRQRTMVASGMTFYDHLWPDVSQQDLGLFAEHSIALGSRWFVRSGLRYDGVSSKAAAADDPGLMGRTVRENYVRFYGPEAAETDREENLISANVVASNRVTEKLSVQGGLGLVSRAAGVTERYFSFAPAPGGFVVGNPSLDAERKWELSLGLSFDTNYWDGSISLYRYRVDDYILPILLGEMDINGDGNPDQLRGFENSRATLTGFEAQTVWQPIKSLSFPLALFYVRGQNEEDGVPLPEIPPLEARAAARWTFGGKISGHLELGGRFAAEQERIDPVFENNTPGFSVWHLRSVLNVAKYVRVEIGVENLFDKQYHEHLNWPTVLPAGDLAAGDEVPQPGRAVIVGLMLDF